MEKESGAETSRPELDRLMANLRAGRIERVVCFKLDRLGRSLTHLALVLDEMNRLRVPLVCTSQGIDTSDDNPAGKLQLGVLMAVAEFERISHTEPQRGTEICAHLSKGRITDTTDTTDSAKNFRRKMAKIFPQFSPKKGRS